MGGWSGLLLLHLSHQSMLVQWQPCRRIWTARK